MVLQGWRALKGLIFLILLSTSKRMAGAMDVSWIPDEENAPLPLSSSYRKSLRRLCEIVKTGSNLPPELQIKKKSIDAQCRKLDMDDNNVNMATKEAAGLSMLSLTLGAICVVGFFVGNSVLGQNMIDAARGYFKRVRLNDLFSQGYKYNSNRGKGRRLGEGDSISNKIMNDSPTMQRIREARLKALSGPSNSMSKRDNGQLNQKALFFNFYGLHAISVRSCLFHLGSDSRVDTVASLFFSSLE